MEATLGLELPALDVIASRDDRSARVDPRPLVLLVSSSDDIEAHLGVVMQGVRRLVTNLEGAFRAARRAKPKLVLVETPTVGAALPLIRQLRANRRTRSAGIAVEIKGNAPSAEAALREAGANIVRDPGQDKITWDRRLLELLRVPLRRAVECSAAFAIRPGGCDRFQGRILNVSVHGMLIEATRALSIGTPLDVSLVLPGDDTPLQLVGQVVRGPVAGPQGLSRCGLKFLLVKGDAQQRITEFVEARP